MAALVMNPNADSSDRAAKSGSNFFKPSSDPSGQCNKAGMTGRAGGAAEH